MHDAVKVEGLLWLGQEEVWLLEEVFLEEVWLVEEGLLSELLVP